jgi:ribose transport system substrate-binding protein
MKNLVWIRLTAAVLLVAVVASCGGQPAEPGKPRVALIMKSLANEFFKTMEDGARAHAAEHAGEFSLIVNGTQSEEDVSGQVNLVEQMMAQGVDAIVIAPADSKALIGVLDRARKQGITVVNIDNKLDDAVLAERGLQIPFVGPNNREGARKAAEYLAARLEPAAPVAILEGIPSAFNAIQRKQGFVDAMNAAGMNIVTSQSANWEMSQANQVASGILNEHPEVKALLCANDSMALGAHAAVRQAGKVGVVQIIGFDNIGAVRELVQAGGILCTVDQHGDQLAVYGIEFALRMLDSDAAPEDQETPVDLITAETLANGSAAR